MSGMQPMAGHVPVQVEAGEMPAMGLGKLFGQVEQSLEEELTVPPACGHAVREVSAPMRKLLLKGTGRDLGGYYWLYSHPSLW